MRQLIMILTIMFTVNYVSAECERSRFLMGAEDVCWTKKVEVIERISYAQKKILNFAKKKLGMEAGEKEEPQKCDYYYCIFSEMNLINPEFNVPCIQKTSNWVKKNVIYDQAVVLLERIQACSAELKKSSESKEQFLADNVGSSDRSVIYNEQSKCEIAAQYMKCVAALQEDPECPIFQYP